MPTKTLLRTAIAILLLASASHAQTLDQTLSGCNGAAPLRTLQGTKDDYLMQLDKLIPGDRLQLAAGLYVGGLDLRNKNGQPGQCIVIEGPASGSPAIFNGSDAWNLVRLQDSSYIALRNLTLDGLSKDGDGIKAEAGSVSVHHILIEGLTIKNFNQNQQIVGINTKCPAWNWVVRYTTIFNTGTGMYFGGSNGEYEFANSLIEHNFVYGTLGYNAEFKHQLSRNTSIGVPATATTIIRHNTFSKETGSSSGLDARPNLLVGHWPLSGAGSSDIYQIYGNFFYQNPYEALFQGEGNVALHDNLFVHRAGDAVHIQPHNSVPRRIDIFNNTVVATGTGISVSGADTAYTQRVVGNAVFAGAPLSGGQQSNNVTGTYNSSPNPASTFLNNPMAAPGSGLDLYPKTGQLQGTAIDYSNFSGLLEWDRDFNEKPRVATFRGAYSGDGVNPGWMPALTIKPAPSTGNVLQNGVPVSGLSGATNSQQFWTMTVPSGMSTLQFQTSGGTGDADLYVKFGSAPTLTTYDCGPVSPSNAELCSFTSPAAGTWYVMVHGWAAYSGATLVGSYSTCNAISDVEPNNSTGAPQVISGSCNQISGTFLNDATTQVNDYFRLSVPAGRTVTALLNGLTVDYDLEIYNAAGSRIAYSTNGGTTADQTSWTNAGGSAVNVYVRVYRYSSTRTTYQLRVSY